MSRLHLVTHREEFKPGTLVRRDDGGTLFQRGPEQGKGMIVGENRPSFFGVTVEI